MDWIKLLHPGNPGSRKISLSVRDSDIFRVRSSGVSVLELADQFGLLEKRIWGICAEGKNYLDESK